jgi:hypothetical protein
MVLVYASHAMSARTAVTAVALAAALAVTASAGTLCAQPTRGEADALIDRGVTIREQNGSDAEALELFRRAWDRGHAPRARAQMALAEQALGRWLDAEADMTAALAVGNDPWIAARRAALEAARDEIARRVARLEVIGNVPGAEVRLDGLRAAVLPMTAPVRVVAGTYRLEVRAEGHYPVAREIDLTGGQLSRETVALQPRPRTSAGVGVSTSHGVSPSSPARGASGPSPWPFVLGGAGIAALGSAAVFGLLQQGAVARLEELCEPLDRLRCDNSSGEAGRRLGDVVTLSVITDVALALGAVAVTTAVVWLLSSSLSSASHAPRSPRALRTRAAGAF